MGIKSRYVWPYLVFVLTISCLVWINARIILNGTVRQKELANTLNLAGRQRYLSQKFVTNLLLTAHSRERSIHDQDEMDLWSRIHHALQMGDTSFNLTQLTGSEFEQVFAKLNPIQSELYNLLLVQPGKKLSHAEEDQVLSLHTRYFSIMDNLVLMIQNRTHENLLQLRNQQIWVAIASGLLLLLEIFILIIPNHRKLIQTNSQLHFHKQALLESEIKFRTFFESSQGLMCTHDLEGNLIEVNYAGADLLGYTVDEAKKMNLYDLVPEEHHKLVRVYLQTILRNQKSKGILYFRHKLGEIKTLMFNNVLTDQNNGGYVIGNAIDITERFKLENDLKYTKEKLEQTNKIAGIGGWEYDITTGKLYWSEITRAIAEVPENYKPEIESAIHFYKEGASRNTIRNVIEKAMRDGSGWDEELQFVTHKGREIWVRAQGSAEFEHGVCRKLLGTFQDIDERKKIQIEISNSRKQLADLLQSATDVSIISTDTQGIIQVFNKGAENMLGYAAEEVVNKFSPGIIHDAHEVEKRGRELSGEFGIKIEGFRVFVHKSEIEGSEQREWTYIHKNGSRKTVSLVVSCIRDTSDRITGYLGVAIDITKEKTALLELENEKSRLQAFVNHAPASVAMFDTELRYIAVSNRWMEDYKLQSKSIIGLSHYEVFPNISDEWKEIHQRCLRGMVEKKDEDVWRPQGWDHDQYMKWEIRPWYLYDGKIGGIMMFTQDITELIRQREELHIARKMAEEASKAKSEFLANMSHEIRTPLNGVIGFTDLLMKTKVDETQKQYLSIINQSGNTLLSIINDILDFSKIEAGKLELDSNKSDIFEIGSQAADIISYQVQKKGLELLLNISTELPRFIWVDEIRIKQVLINLLSNAAKFTDKGEIELKIRPLSKLENDSIHLRFEIRDTGIGIKPERQHHIFEAFLQEDASVTKKYGGTGLGLTISNKILQLMGSQLQLHSIPGKGSTFYFDLHLKAEQGDPLNWDGLESIKRVLIVDDNENNRVILRNMMRLKHIMTVESTNGAEALALLSKGELFDVIIMDYHMPVMSGLETIQKIRQSFSMSPDQPIILLYSSSSDESIISLSNELNVQHRLVKPIKMQELFNVLRRLRKPEPAYKRPAAEKPAEILSHTEHPKILVVEDNEFNLLLAKTLLKRIVPGSEILEAVNGIEAVNIFREMIPDLILMDVQMPVMNGYEATRIIRTIPTKTRVPIIALTAGNVKGEKETCLEAGMDDFLGKPVVESDILQVLKQWLPKEPGKKNGILQPVVHVDVNKLLALGDNDPSFIQEMMVLAKKDLTTTLGKIIEASKRQDIASLNTWGHTLKGVSLNMGLPVLTKLAEKLELIQTADAESIQTVVQELETEVTLVLQLLQEHIQSE